MTLTIKPVPATAHLFALIFHNVTFLFYSVFTLGYKQASIDISVWCSLKTVTLTCLCSLAKFTKYG